MRAVAGDEGAPQGMAQGRAGSRVVSALAPGTSLEPCQDVGPCMGTAQGPWPGRRAPWGAGDRPCCAITGAMDGLTQGPGLWAGTAEPAGAPRAGKNSDNKGQPLLYTQARTGVS